MKTILLTAVLAAIPGSACAQWLAGQQAVAAAWAEAAASDAVAIEGISQEAPDADKTADKAPAHVTTLEQLKSRIAQAKEGETIRIATHAVFNMTQEPPLLVDKPVTLLGNRIYEIGGKPLFISRGKPMPMIIISAPGAKLMGLKIEGMEKDTKKEEIIALNSQGISGVYQFPVTRGVEVNASNVAILNCELEGFSHAAISLKSAKDTLIKYNYIHHNQRHGLGYGVVLSGDATALIERNRFDYNRHSIAGTGHPGQIYEAALNLFGENHIDTPLDMHGGKDRKDNTQIAGKKVDIHDNVILTTEVRAFIHRGIAEDTVLFRHNTLYYPDQKRTIGYSNGVTEKNLPAGKFRFYDNIFKKF